MPWPFVTVAVGIEVAAITTGTGVSAMTTGVGSAGDGLVAAIALSGQKKRDSSGKNPVTVPVIYENSIIQLATATLWDIRVPGSP